MKSIVVSKLNKTFKQPLRAEGFLPFVKSVMFPKYKEINAVKEVSFEIEEGELIGFIGPNGAG